MQLPAKVVAHKQLIQTVGLTSAAFLIALPVGAAVLPHGNVAQAEGTTTTVTRTVDGTDSCTTGVGHAVTSAVRHTTTGGVTQTGGSGINQNGTGNQASQNNGGATAQASDHSIAAAVKVGDVLSNNLSHNNIPVLSGNTVNVPVNVPVSVPVLGTSTVTNLLGGLGL